MNNTNADKKKKSREAQACPPSTIVKVRLASASMEQKMRREEGKQNRKAAEKKEMREEGCEV